VADSIRIVRNRSIRNVDDARLQDSLQQIHSMVHTPEGLHAWDAPRRHLYNYGIKALAIRDELLRRNVEPTVEGCLWCSQEARRG
jgi:hypothetical protein